MKSSKSFINKFKMFFMVIGFLSVLSFIGANNLSAETINLDNTSTEIRPQLQGIWTCFAISKDKGRTKQDTYQGDHGMPFVTAYANYLKFVDGTEYQIKKVREFQLPNSKDKTIYTALEFEGYETLVWIISCVNSRENIYLIQKMESAEETLRMVVVIE